jgi:ankyrin repeat protein
MLLFLLFSYYEELFADNIFNAILGADFNNAKAILERHPEFVNARDQNKNTPLHIAAEMGMVDVARLLISKGACITAKNTDAMTPLHYAVQ